MHLLRTESKPGEKGDAIAWGTLVISLASSAALALVELVKSRANSQRVIKDARSSWTSVVMCSRSKAFQKVDRRN